MGCRRVGDQRRQASRTEQAIPEHKSTDRRAFLPKLSGAVFIITDVTHYASCRKLCQADCQSWSWSTDSECEPVAPFQLRGCCCRDLGDIVLSMPYSARQCEANGILQEHRLLVR